MADGSGIEWTDATWNPIVGCSVVSPGCTNCYAMRVAGARTAHTAKYQGLTKASKAGPVWTGDVRLWERALTTHGLTAPPSSWLARFAPAASSTAASGTNTRPHPLTRKGSAHDRLAAYRDGAAGRDCGAALFEERAALCRSAPRLESRCASRSRRVRCANASRSSANAPTSDPSAVALRASVPASQTPSPSGRPASTQSSRGGSHERRPPQGQDPWKFRTYGTARRPSAAAKQDQKP